MKMLVLNWQDIRNPLGGGAEVHLHEIFARIAGRGHEVTLYCSRFEGAAEREVIDGIEVIREGGRNMFNFFVPRRYRSDFRRRGFDIVIDDLNKIPFYTPLYVREPLMAIAHHFFGSSIFLEAGKAAGSYVYLAEKMVDYVYKSTPFAVVSDSTLEEFLARGFRRELFRVIPNCIDQETLPMRIGAKSAEPRIAYFGRLKKYKSVDHVLKAFAQVKAALPAAQLHVLGSGSFRPELEKLAESLGIAGSTRFFGYVSESEKIRLLSEAHVVVNPSMKEGWGITNIEANACGTPVVSANVPGLRDSVQEGRSGLLYPYGDIAALRDALLNILQNMQLALTLRQGALAWAKSFNWDASADAMLAFAHDVAAGKPNTKRE